MNERLDRKGCIGQNERENHNMKEERLDGRECENNVRGLEGLENKNSRFAVDSGRIMMSINRIDINICNRRLGGSSKGKNIF